MYTAGKKTKAINAFIRTSVVHPRDLYARYGERVNPRAIHGTDATTPSDVVPNGGSVIQSMIAGQESLRRHLPSENDSG